MPITLPLPGPGGFGLSDLGEQDILRLLRGYPRDGVAHAEVAEVQQRQHPADDEEDVARQTHPLEEGVRLVGQELQRAGLVVANAHGLIELQNTQREERGEAHPGEPYFSDQKLILAARPDQRSSGSRYLRQNRASPAASIPYTSIMAAWPWLAVRAVPIW